MDVLQIWSPEIKGTRLQKLVIIRVWKQRVLITYPTIQGSSPHDSIEHVRRA